VGDVRMNIEKHRRAFVAFMKMQFKDVDIDNIPFEEGGGYHDDTVNAMWVGFCSAITLMEGGLLK
jgi:hypothetical protein